MQLLLIAVDTPKRLATWQVRLGIAGHNGTTASIAFVPYEDAVADVHGDSTLHHTLLELQDEIDRAKMLQGS
jgi:hypothetical protein